MPTVLPPFKVYCPLGNSYFGNYQTSVIKDIDNKCSSNVNTKNKIILSESDTYIIPVFVQQSYATKYKRPVTKQTLALASGQEKAQVRIGKCCLSNKHNSR